MVMKSSTSGPLVVAGRDLGRWYLALLGLWVLSVSLVFLSGELPPLLTLLLAATGWLIAAGPSVAFLRHSFAHRDAGLGRSLRRSATGSGISVIGLGFFAILLELSTRDLMMPVGLRPFRYIGYGFIALGVSVLIRAWTSRVAEEQPEHYALRHQGATGTGVLLALMATMLLPKFSGGSKSSAYRSVLESDLRNLVSAQESFFADSSRYARSLAELPVFQTADGVEEPVIIADASGWSATLTHGRTPGLICGVAVNLPNPVSALPDSAAVVCRENPQH